MALRNRKGCVIALAVVAVLALVPVAWIQWQRNQDARKLEDELRLARSAGLPTTWQEYAALVPRAEPGQNAAPDYRKLASGRKSMEGMAALRDDVTFAPTPEIERRAEALVAESAPALQAVEEAAKKPNCWFDRDWSEGLAVLFLEFADIKRADMIVSIRARLAANRGDAESAIRDAELILKMAEHVGQEPQEIAQLVRLALVRDALTTLAHLSFRHRDPRYAQALERNLGAIAKPDLKRENANRLYELLVLIEQVQTAEGREKLGLREEDMQATPADKIFPLLLPPGKAKIKLVAAARAYWSALELSKPERDAELDRQTQQMLMALLAFPMAARMAEALGSGPAEGQSMRIGAYENALLSFTAISRALSKPQIPRTLDVSDLVGPVDGNRVEFRFDGRQMTVGLVGNAKRIKIPPEPRSGGSGT